MPRKWDSSARWNPRSLASLRINFTKMKKLTALLFLLSFSLFAADTPDLTMQTRIREEGFRNSKVMEIAETLTDDIGPRLTGSPNMKRANEWTRDKLTEFGLSNAHLEPWGPFGHGWSYDSCSLRLVSPDVAQLWALPRAWTPSTNGAVRGSAVHVKLETKEDLEKNKGKLGGKFVLLGDEAEQKPHDTLQFKRYDEKSLEEEGRYTIPPVRQGRFGPEEIRRRREFGRALAAFFAEEKPLAVIIPGGGDYGNFHVQGG